MTLAQLLVIAGGIGLIAALARYFFQGGYQPNPIRARTGSPLRLAFDRREDGDCTAPTAVPAVTDEDAEDVARRAPAPTVAQKAPDEVWT